MRMCYKHSPWRPSYHYVHEHLSHGHSSTNACEMRWHLPLGNGNQMTRFPGAKQWKLPGGQWDTRNSSPSFLAQGFSRRVPEPLSQAVAPVEPCFRASLVCDGLSQDTRELPTLYQWQKPFQSGQEWVPGRGPCPWGRGWELLCVLTQPEEAYPKTRHWIRVQRPPKQSSQ